MVHINRQNAASEAESEKEVDVGKAVYRRHAIGDMARVTLHPGLFSIPWFSVQ